MRVEKNETKSNELVKRPSHELDGFDTFEMAVEGGEEPMRRVIQGELIRFTNEALWVTRDGEELPADLELIAVDIARFVQKWRDGKPLDKETIIVAPGEKIPDVDRMNSATPQNEWIEGPDGKPRGPWQFQYLMYLLDPKLMGLYTYATGTVGGGMAVREITDRIRWIRKARGANVHPVVALSDVHMRTRFGGRQRPQFVVKRWVVLGDGAADHAALPGPTAGGAGGDASGMRTVEPPSVREELEDGIRF